AVRPSGSAEQEFVCADFTRRGMLAASESPGLGSRYAPFSSSFGTLPGIGITRARKSYVIAAIKTLPRSVAFPITASLRSHIGAHRRHGGRQTPGPRRSEGMRGQVAGPHARPAADGRMH